MTRNRLQINNFQSIDIPDQSGRKLLITGANNSLGLQAAAIRAGWGAIILACRNQTTGREALDQVQAVGPAAEHHLVGRDLGVARERRPPLWMWRRASTC